ncbi:MAG: energy transducer TonB [Agarilytica sp.]
MKLRIKHYIAQPLIVAVLISFCAHMFTLSVLQKWLFGDEGKSTSGLAEEILHIEMKAPELSKQQEAPERQEIQKPEEKEFDRPVGDVAKKIQAVKEEPNMEMLSPPVLQSANEVSQSESGETHAEQVQKHTNEMSSRDHMAPDEEKKPEPATSDALAGKKESQELSDEPVFAQNIDYLYTPVPEYPAIAKRLRQEGTVILKVRVNILGEPIKLMLHESSNYKSLDKAALKGVAEWQFSPHLVGNQPVEAWALIPIEFKLQR